jgi:hypothetical protein
MNKIISVCQFIKSESLLRQEMEFPSRVIIDAKAFKEVMQWKFIKLIVARFSSN